MDFSFHIINFTLGLLAWMSIGLIAFRISQKKAVKLKVWKIIFVLYIGIFSFTINWPMFDAVVRIPVLPLGVWLLYFVLKQKEGRWEKYRSFAWLGFWANGMFLATTLLAVPLQHVMILNQVDLER